MMTNDEDISGRYKRLFSTVVEGGYCIGCGICASLPMSPVKIELDLHGKFQPILLEPTNYSIDESIDPLEVCPFSEESTNEFEIGRELFGKYCSFHDKTGYFIDMYAGYVEEGAFRQAGSSGGMASWLLCELFQMNLIDGAIHVHSCGKTNGNQLLFNYSLSTTIDEIVLGAKSRYYPVQMADIIRIIRKRPGRYAFVGIPCFNKALRLLSRQDSVLQDRVSYYIGLICGHLKSSRFADMLAWQCGISPGGITSIDFRKKIKGLDANKYGVELEGFSGGKKIREIRKNKDFFGYLWSHGFFKYQACDYCDDVFAETSDVTVGDAWIPQYISDYMGTNIVIVRSHVIHDIIQKARSRERINMKSIPLKDILLSQDAGLRHRRDGLAYRLYLKSESGKWYPPKRISPKKYSSNSRFARVNQLRMQIAEYSHKAFDKAVCMDDFSIFKKSMSLLIREHDIANGKTFLIRIKTRIKSKIKIWLNCLGFYKNS